MKQHNLFPTLVHEYEFTDLELEPLLNFSLNSPTKSHGLLSEGATSSYSLKSHILNQFVAKHVRKKIESCLDEYANRLNVEPLRITDSWFNVMGKDQYLERHRHEVSVVSGALYLHTSPGSVALRLHSPLASYRMCERHSDTNPKHSPNWIDMPVKKGTLILFPSWLEHSSKLNKSEKRIVVSFNSDFR